MAGKCTKDMSAFGGFGSYPCGRKTKPGTDFCGIHSLEAEAKREAEKRARWAEKDRISNEKYKKEKFGQMAADYHESLVAALRKARALAASPNSFELVEVENDFACLLAKIDAESKGTP